MAPRQHRPAVKEEATAQNKKNIKFEGPTAPHLVARRGSGSTENPSAVADTGFGNGELHTTLDSAAAHASRAALRAADAAAAHDDSLVPRFTSKRLCDVLGALTLALLFAPLMIIVSVCLSRTGGVIYRHRRVGKGGRTFECLKFRTMVPNADRILHDVLNSDEALKAEWLQGHKLRNDPRITPMGRFLRRTSLDELPQIWNVLRGDMSLVGPRPVIREELLRYGRASSAYLAVKPGITGLWQTMGRNDTDYRRRVAIDVYYVRHRSLRLDAYILAKTVRVVVVGDGAY